MAQITLNFPNGVQDRVINAISNRFSYRATIIDPGDPANTIPNPETKGQFSIRMVKEQVKRWVVQDEAVQAGNTANDNQRTTSETDIDIT